MVPSELEGDDGVTRNLPLVPGLLLGMLKYRVVGLELHRPEMRIAGHLDERNLELGTNERFEP